MLCIVHYMVIEHTEIHARTGMLQNGIVTILLNGKQCGARGQRGLYAGPVVVFFHVRMHDFLFVEVWQKTVAYVVDLQYLIYSSKLAQILVLDWEMREIPFDFIIYHFDTPAYFKETPIRTCYVPCTSVLSRTMKTQILTKRPYKHPPLRIIKSLEKIQSKRHFPSIYNRPE
jgi:hypothetical protein